MQPYFFPYIGYYQLAAAADFFVVLDDVSYIKQGWINRNRLQVNGKPAWFTLPLSAAGSNVIIRDVHLDTRRYSHWRMKFLKAVEHNYKRSAFYAQTLNLIDYVLPPAIEANLGVAKIAARSLEVVMEYLGLPLRSGLSSAISLDAKPRGAERVIRICQYLSARSYLNLPGGTELYDRQAFSAAGLALGFVTPGNRALAAGMAADGSQLSILHVLMHQDIVSIRSLLSDHRVD